MRRGLLVVVISLLLSTLAAAPALAEQVHEGRFRNYAALVGTGVHTCPHNECPLLGIVPVGGEVTDFCYGQGQYLGGTTAWDLVYSPNLEKAGWVNERWLVDNGQVLPCNLSGQHYMLNSADTPGAGIHTCPDNTCPTVGFIPVGASVTDFCWTDGQEQQETTYWDLVYYNGVAGWTHEYWLSSEAQAWGCTPF